MEEYSKAHVVVIPAFRVHTTTVVQAMALGKVVLCSGGWGFKELVEDRVTGLVAEMSPRTNSWVDEDGIFRERYSPMNHVDQTTVENLKNHIHTIMNSPDLIRQISKNAIERAQQNHSIAVRNKALKELFDEFAPTKDSK